MHVATPPHSLIGPHEAGDGPAPVGEEPSPALLLFHDPAGVQRVVALQAERERVTIGRRSAVDVSLTWDPEVSRLHAELMRVGGEWTLVDDGLSANGSYVNGERVMGRRRLHDGDVVRIGATSLLFREVRDTSTPPTDSGSATPVRVGVSDAQRRILVALCRPFKDSPAFAVPATNEQIAREVFLTAGAVKKHLRVLFARFELGDLPQNEKRLRLAERALGSGVISPAELKPPPPR